MDSFANAREQQLRDQMEEYKAQSNDREKAMQVQGYLAHEKQSPPRTLH